MTVEYACRICPDRWESAKTFIEHLVRDHRYDRAVANAARCQDGSVHFQSIGDAGLLESTVNVLIDDRLVGVLTTRCEAEADRWYLLADFALDDPLPSETPAKPQRSQKNAAQASLF